MPIDLNKLNEIFGRRGSEPTLKGKVINVVNHIPYNCILKEDTSNSQVAAKLKLMQKQRQETVSESTSITDPNPISHSRRRHSTITALGETNNWHLTQRRGHSAMYAALNSLKQNYRTLYVGGTGSITTDDKSPVDIEDLNDIEKENLTTLLMDKYDITPIFIPDKLSAGHYEGYSKQVLWPLMHYLMWSDSVNESKLFNEYAQANAIVANEVIKHYEEGDIIWVHDYHLMLVPQLLRKELPHAQIGFFLHTPFPSSELFRCLPHRKEILEGMLDANLVAFQTYDYGRHFSSTCTRVLGCQYSPYGILRGGNLVQVEIYPIGIDADHTRDYLLRPGVALKYKAIKERYSGKKLIVGRDKLDPVKGVLQKLEAFEKFLDDYPQWRNEVCLIQVTTPGVLDAVNLENKANEIVARINGKYGSLEFSPANFFNQEIDRDEYYALLQVADIGLITPVIDGMNTTSFEYVISQDSSYSPLILSEFTGTASSFSAAIIVNPWDYSEISRAIAECLEMSKEEKYDKHKQLYRFVTTHTASFWSKSLVEALVGLSKNTKVSKDPLDFSRVKLEYIATHKRAFFFDYDGSLVPICKKPEDAKPSKTVIQTLTKLSENSDNIVWVISGRTKIWLDDCLGNIPNLGLSSEHGCFIKYPRTNNWISVIENYDLSWKDDVREIFDYYTERTPGSFVEEKECSLVWNYRNTEPRFGPFQAKECQNHLEQNLVGKLPIECITNKMNLEVRPNVINKGIIINRAMIQSPDIEFILCVGDDYTDEDMFRVLESKEMGGVDVIQFTVLVGSSDRNTQARWRLQTNSDVIKLLQLLVSDSSGIST